MLALAGIVNKKANEWRINEFSFGHVNSECKKDSRWRCPAGSWKGCGYRFGKHLIEVVAEAVGIDG